MRRNTPLRKVLPLKHSIENPKKGLNIYLGKTKNSKRFYFQFSYFNLRRADMEDNINFITGNINKFNEVSKLFQEANLNLKLEQLDLDPIEIQADTLKEVALFKLNNIKDKVDGSYFVEDAGFFVDQPLNGFPGVYSSYVFKTIGNKAILKSIESFDNTEAHFAAAIALYFKPLDKTIVFEGIVKGKVSTEMKGSNGFGFDPIFIPEEIPDKTFAELTMEKKNKISHRGRALKKLISFLKENR